MNSILGMLIFAAGGLAGAMFLLPARGIKGWAYESWWMAYLFFGLIVCPPLICSFTVPDFWRVTMSAPWSVLGRCAAFGMMWGIGSLAWGLMVRYLGIGLGLAIGCGLCAATGTLIPPIAAGKAADLVKDTGAIIVLSGVLLSLVGIVFVGLAGKLKEAEMPEEQKKKAVAEFDFKKGVVTALIAGLFSAGMNFGLQGAETIENAAVAAGAKACWRGMPVIMVVLWGGFIVQVLWCLQQNIKNRTFGDYARPSLRNLSLAALIGVLWVLQFVCTKAGEPLMGSLKYISFAVVMASTILFSTTIGVFLGEWKGVGARTKGCLTLGTLIMLAGFCAISFGSR
jgi:L-rhamnose-H+ transport protein